MHACAREECCEETPRGHDDDVRYVMGPANFSSRLIDFASCYLESTVGKFSEIYDFIHGLDLHEPSLFRTRQVGPTKGEFGP